MCLDFAVGSHPIVLAGLEGSAGLSVAQVGVELQTAQVVFVVGQLIYRSIGLEACPYAGGVEAHTAGLQFTGEWANGQVFHKMAHGEVLCRGCQPIGLGINIYVCLSSHSAAALRQQQVCPVLVSCKANRTSGADSVGHIHGLQHAFGQHLSDSLQVAGVQFQFKVARAVVLHHEVRIALRREFGHARHPCHEFFDFQVVDVAIYLCMQRQRFARHGLQIGIVQIAARQCCQVVAPNGSAQIGMAVAAFSFGKRAEIECYVGRNCRVRRVKFKRRQLQAGGVHPYLSAQFVHRQSAAFLEGGRAQSGAQFALVVVAQGVDNQCNVGCLNVVGVDALYGCLLGQIVNGL